MRPLCSKPESLAGMLDRVRKAECRAYGFWNSDESSIRRAVFRKQKTASTLQFGGWLRETPHRDFPTVPERR